MTKEVRLILYEEMFVSLHPQCESRFLRDHQLLDNQLLYVLYKQGQLSSLKQHLFIESSETREFLNEWDAGLFSICRYFVGSFPDCPAPFFAYIIITYIKS